MTKRTIISIEVCILLSLIIIAFSGCCRNVVPLKSQTTEVVRTEYIQTIRIDTVKVQLPAEHESIHTLDTMSHLETSIAASDASYANGVLHHSITNKSSYQPAVEVPVIDTYERSDSVRTEYVDKPVYMPLSAYQRSMMSLGWILVSICIVLFVYGIFKVVIKFKNRESRFL